MKVILSGVARVSFKKVIDLPEDELIMLKNDAGRIEANLDENDAVEILEWESVDVGRVV